VNVCERSQKVGIHDRGSTINSILILISGALEGQYFRTTNKSVSLSEQMLLDCSSKIASPFSCYGGSMLIGFNYVQKHGIQYADRYVYRAQVRKNLFFKFK
jgi:hypothetical protein